MSVPRSSFLAALLLALLAGTADAQRRVTGRVLGEGTSEPLAAASVTVVGTTIGTYTDDAGRFALEVPSSEVTLLVRRIGFRRASVVVPPGQSEVAVSLVRDVLQLEGQVITGTQTSVARQNAANDVATISAEELSRVPTPTIESALQGKVAGAYIQANSGAPGGGMQVQFRGVSSVFASADPLYVVDGVIVSNEAIASGANAITQAAGGGNASPQDNATNRIADINPNDIERIEFLKGASASAIYGSKATNGVVVITTKRGTSGRPVFNITQRVGTFDLANKIGTRRFTLDEAFEYAGSNEPDPDDVVMSVEEVEAAYAECGGFCDHEEGLYGENELSYETSLSIRGGTAATRYFASGLIKRDEGIMQGTGYSKQSLRVNLGQQINSRLNVDLTSFLVHSLAQRGLSNNDNSGTSFYMVLPFTPSFVPLAKLDGAYRPNPFERSNPYQTRDLLQNEEDVFRFTGAAQATFAAYASPTQTLNLNASIGADNFNQGNDIFSPVELFYEPQDLQPGTIVRGSTDGLNLTANLGAVHTWTPAALGFTATTSVGVQRERRELQLTRVTARDLIAGQENIDQAAAIQTFEDRYLTKDFAIFGQEEVLMLDERLLLTVGGRAERSTNNGDIDKFYVFPKAAASYRFVSPVTNVDDLKFRVAVGQAGNQPPFGFKFTSLLSAVNTGRIGYFVNDTAGAVDIAPEITTEFEGGVDAALFDSRASLSLTAYLKRTNDLILQRTAAPSTGYEVEFFNGGEMENRGIELALAVTPVQTGSITWISRATFARNVNEVTELPVPAYQTGGFGTNLGAFQLEEGKSATQIVGDGPGGAIVQLGDAAPDFQMSFPNEVLVGAWRFYGLLDWKKGGEIINLTEFLYDAAGLSHDYETAGAERITTWAVDGLTAPYIQDGSYVKLREISVSYELPENLVGQLFRGQVSRARLELAGRNLATWTDYRGADPEVSNFGSQQIVRNIDVAPYPPSRSFFLSVDVDF